MRLINNRPQRCANVMVMSISYMIPIGLNSKPMSIMTQSPIGHVYAEYSQYQKKERKLFKICNRKLDI